MKAVYRLWDNKRCSIRSTIARIVLRAVDPRHHQPGLCSSSVNERARTLGQSSAVWGEVVYNENAGWQVWNAHSRELSQW